MLVDLCNISFVGYYLFLVSKYCDHVQRQEDSDAGNFKVIISFMKIQVCLTGIVCTNLRCIEICRKSLLLKLLCLTMNSELRCWTGACSKGFGQLICSKDCRGKWTNGQNLR
jgi:hypothetical protein